LGSGHSWNVLSDPELLRAQSRARICKRSWSPGINSDGPVPPAYVAWRAGTTNRVVVQARHAGNRFLGSLKGLQIRALILSLRNEMLNLFRNYTADFGSDFCPEFYKLDIILISLALSSNVNEQVNSLFVYRLYCLVGSGFRTKHIVS
jgi:hypothetical protein